MCGPVALQIDLAAAADRDGAIALPSAAGSAPACRNSALAAIEVVARNKLVRPPPAFLIVMETVTGFAVSSVSMHHGMHDLELLELVRVRLRGGRHKHRGGGQRKSFPNVMTAPSERIGDAGEDAIARSSTAGRSSR